MNNISKIKTFINNFLSKQSINPKRDWNILIILFIIFIIISIGFDAYMYKKIVNGDMYVSVNRADLVIEDLKTDDLKKILDNFESEKNLVTNQKLENLVDPSI